MMTQPSDPLRATTRRDPRHIVEITDVESVSDAQADAAIQAVQMAIHYLYSGEGAPPISKEEDDRAYVQCQDAFELLLRYTRGRQMASLNVAERFNTSRREINGRLVRLQAELDERNEQLAKREESLAQLQAWVDEHDPLLIELEASDAKLREEKLALEGKLEAARQEIVALTADQGRLSTELAQAKEEIERAQYAEQSALEARDEAKQKQEEQRLTRGATETQLRTENERLKAELAKAKQECECAQYAEQAALEARDEALKAKDQALQSKATAVKDYNDLKRQVGSKVLQPILVIGTSADIAKGRGKTEEQLIKLFPSPNFARFLIKVLEAMVHFSQKPTNIDALVDEVKLARSTELDPYFDPRQPFPEAMAHALNECRVWFGKLIPAFEEKGRQLSDLVEQRAELQAWCDEVLQVLRELRKEAQDKKI